MTIENKKNITEKSTLKSSEVVVETNKTDVNSKKPFRSYDKEKKPFNRSPFNKDRQDFKNNKEQSEFSEKVIAIRKIYKVTTGGRRLRFSATVAIGDKKGTVGFGVAKANETSEAIKKAINVARKNLQKVIITKEFSIPHGGVGKYCSSQILLKPAKEGIGVKAGGAAREIIELVGIQNIYSKSLGSNNKINLAKATIEALTSLKPAEYFNSRPVKRKTTDIITEEKK